MAERIQPVDPLNSLDNIVKGGAPDAARARCGDLATYPNQATVFATKGFLCVWVVSREGKAWATPGKHAVKVVRGARAHGVDTHPRYWQTRATLCRQAPSEHTVLHDINVPLCAGGMCFI